jgi:flagellar motor switch protein FliN/FliY
MLPQPEIDTVLSDAQSAVDQLAAEVGQFSDAADSAPARSAGPARLGSLPQSMQRIFKIRVPVVVRLAQRNILLSDVLRLAPGSILEFNRSVDLDLDLMVNNRQIGSGVGVKVGERFGLRVNYVGDVRQRIESLAQS